MPKNEEYESLNSSEENPVSSNIKNIETIQVKSWLKLKINPKSLDLEKLILVRSKSLSKKEITKRLLKIWYGHKHSWGCNEGLFLLSS